MLRLCYNPLQVPMMMFLQGHGISTLYAVKIYKKYGDKAIQIVADDPYQLASDIYVIGFFSADKVALSIGLAIDSPERVIAAIRCCLPAGIRDIPPLRNNRSKSVLRN